MGYKITIKGSFYSSDIGLFDSLDEAVEYAKNEYPNVREVYNGQEAWSVYDN